MGCGHWVRLVERGVTIQRYPLHAVDWDYCHDVDAVMRTNPEPLAYVAHNQEGQT